MNRSVPALVLVTVLLSGSVLLAVPRSLAADLSGSGPRPEGNPVPGPAGDAGSGWIQDRLVTAGYAVDIAAARSAGLWAAVSYRGGGGCGDGVDLYSSMDGGYVWTFQYTINDCVTPFHYWNASIAVDISNDRVYVAVERSDAVLLVIHGDPVGGWTWSALPPSGGADTNPDIVAENDQGLANRVYVASVWDVGAGDNIGLIYTEDDGVTWTWQDVASVGPPDRNQPSVAYANGWLWIAYRLVVDIAFANSNVGLGTPFGIASDILAASCSSVPTTCQWPEVAVVRDGSVGVIAYEYTFSAFDIDLMGVGSTDSGATWSPPVAFAASGTNETAPSLTVDYMTSGSNAVTGLFHIVYVEGPGVVHRTVDPVTIAFGPLHWVSDAGRIPAGDSGYRTASTTQVRGGAWFPVVGMVEPGAFDRALATTPGWTSSFDTAPPGMELIIDGALVTAPFTASWPANSTHQVNVTAPQLEVAGSDRYVFSAWDTLLPQNHTWVAPDLGDVSERATFTRQWWTTVDTDPPGLDVIVDSVTSTAPWSGWWDDAATHSLNVTPLQPGVSGERFSWRNWTDSGAQGHDVNVTAVTNFTARFDHEYRVTIDSQPQGLDVRVDGQWIATPQPYWWASGSTHLLFVNATQGVWSFYRWVEDGSATAPRSVTAIGPANWTANYTVVPLSVTASGTPLTGTAPLSVAFTATGAAGTTPYTFAWQFGDGTTGSGASASHSYATAGTYQVNVTVTDNATATATASLTVTVTTPPLVLDRCTVTPSPVTVTPGGTQTFVAQGLTSGSVEVPGATVAWTTSGGIGTVSTAGVFTAGTAVGSGSVNATVTFGSVSRSCSASVTVATELPWLLIGLVLIVVIGLVLFLLLWMRRKKPVEMPASPQTFGGAEGSTPSTLSEGAPTDGLATRLARLKDARDKGVLSEEEYQAKREAALREL